VPGSRRQRRPGRPPQRGSRAPLDPARLAAYDVLRAVRAEDAYANLVLPHVLARLGLSGRDAAFATELASGTLRLQGRYDAILGRCVDRPLAKVEARVLDALRLGAHQLLGMRVPDHAAISTTVDLVRAKANAGAAGFANAVLRKVAARPLAGWLADLTLAERTSHPDWVLESLAAALRAGDEAEPAEAELSALLEADNEPPRVVLVARPGLAERAELPGQPTPLSPYGVVLAGGSPAEVDAVREGRAGVQDEGSQLIAVALAQAAIEGPDARWLDLCAGPGGKAALLAALARQHGADLVANEVQPHRAGLVAANLRATGGAVIAADGTRPPFTPGTFDRVLVDAPCTGLGALRRRPEARWRRRPEDVAILVDLQTRLLASALDLTRPGGVVLYSTCSPVIAETRGVVETVLAGRDDVALTPLTLAVPDAAGPLPGTRQLWPHRHGTDAMFLALLTRRPLRH
jgi:16S rRNA (cytosine967-C5)-methyltransferase